MPRNRLATSETLPADSRASAAVVAPAADAERQSYLSKQGTLPSGEPGLPDTAYSRLAIASASGDSVASPSTLTIRNTLARLSQRQKRLQFCAKRMRSDQLCRTVRRHSTMQRLSGPSTSSPNLPFRLLSSPDASRVSGGPGYRVAATNYSTPCPVEQVPSNKQGTGRPGPVLTPQTHANSDLAWCPFSTATYWPQALRGVFAGP
ncbi:hypothetical protein Purlil1_7044 [Purpureocillium lilacinum]|uniref:Uncharacterized protein n=1 Tax=Purpureocillium lilacinum TaxID=33203 RepID=A0ABR0BXU4_PURLI|nr:hypothetical protein Purlil1_7044 [Purpureocillium lilacinum]